MVIGCLLPSATTNPTTAGRVTEGAKLFPTDATALPGVTTLGVPADNLGTRSFLKSCSIAV